MATKIMSEGRAIVAVSRLDANHRIYHSVNGSAFCPETLTVFTRDQFVRTGNVASISTHDYETVHETFHWATTCYTSAGLMLSLARYARMKLILDLVQQQGNILRGPDRFSGRPTVPKFGFDDLASLTHPDNDLISPEVCNIGILHAFEKLYLYGSETIPAFRSAEQPFHPLHVTVRAIDLMFFEQERYRTGPSSEAGLSRDKLQRLATALSTNFGFASTGPARKAVDTVDLFEAFSVVADICAAMNQGDQRAADGRLRSIRGTHYVVAITAILRRLDLPVDIHNIWKYWPTLFAILELALNPPTLPATNIIAYQTSWATFYPPLRAILAANAAMTFGRFVTNQDEAATIDIYYGKLKEVLDPTSAVHALPARRRGPSFFDVFETDAKLSRNKQRWDWFDVILELYEGFQGGLQVSGFLSLTGMVASGQYLKLRRAYPPAIITGDGELGYQSTSSKTLAEQWLVLMAVWFGLEDIARGVPNPTLTPFRSEATIKKDWYSAACAEASAQINSALGVKIEFS